MHKHSVSFILLFAAWLAFTSSTSTIEISVGLAISIIIALIAGNFMFTESPWVLFNPSSFVGLGIYSAGLAASELTSIAETTKSIITGKINPAIVEIPTRQTRDFTKTLVANSITLTPGTLTLRVSEDAKSFYIHTLNYAPKKDISGNFEKLAKKVIP